MAKIYSLKVLVHEFDTLDQAITAGKYLSSIYSLAKNTGQPPRIITNYDGHKAFLTTDVSAGHEEFKLTIVEPPENTTMDEIDLKLEEIASG